MSLHLFRSCLAALLFFSACITNSPAFAQSAKEVFERYQKAVLQIKVIDQSSGSKSSFGSGFVIDAAVPTEGQIVVTNYHVISSYLSKPEHNRLEIQYLGETYQGIEVLDIDVINDLALLRWSKGNAQSLSMTMKTPQQGVAIFSFGDPHDIGLTVVPGTYNGIDHRKFYQRIHLTASINPGMSGGPAINSDGEVVGINVATAGNQISFLVPVEKLNVLLADYTRRDQSIAFDSQERINSQLVSSQSKMYQQLISSPWKTDHIGAAKIFAEMVPYVRCWGSTDEGEKTGLLVVSKGCHSEDRIHVGRWLTTGVFEYEFIYLKDKEGHGFIDEIRFYNQVKTRMAGAVAGNRAGKDDVSRYQCKERIVEHQSITNLNSTSMQTSLCIRSYLEYPELYDVFYVGTSIDRENEALLSHFTLSGIDKELAKAFVAKFLEGTGWK